MNSKICIMRGAVLPISFFLWLTACEASAPGRQKDVEVLGEHPGKKKDQNAAEPPAKQSIGEKYIGRFSVSVETESTTTGMASIEYLFTITGEHVRLETNTYHEPIRCNGVYQAIGKSHTLELYYTGSEAYCDTENPMFFLKEEKGELYAKGLGSEGTYHDWIRLKRL